MQWKKVGQSTLKIKLEGTDQIKMFNLLKKKNEK